MIRYDLTNWIIVTGETLEELRINWQNRINDERTRNRGLNDYLQGLDEQP